MAVYNGGRFLSAAIESVLRQTFHDFEFIIVDDGSTDETGDVISRYAKADDRIVLVSQENRGQAAALNRGCGLARGEYIARMDADDVALPFRFEWQTSFLKDHPDTGLLGGAVQEIDARNNSLRKMVFPTGDQEIRRREMQFNCFCHPTVMFRKSVFEETCGYRPAFVHADDYDLWLRMAERQRVANLPEVILNYRTHEDQITARSLRQQLISVLGSRAAARARRAGTPEPFEQETPVTMEDLQACQVSRTEVGETFRKAFRSVAIRLSDESVTVIAFDWLGDHFLESCLQEVSPKTMALIHKYRAKGEYRSGKIFQCGSSLLKMAVLDPGMLRRTLSSQIARFIGIGSRPLRSSSTKTP